MIQAISVALMAIRRVFGPELILVENPQHDNLLVLAFRGATPQMPTRQRLRELGARWGIDFVSLAERLRRLST